MVATLASRISRSAKSVCTGALLSHSGEVADRRSAAVSAGVCGPASPGQRAAGIGRCVEDAERRASAQGGGGVIRDARQRGRGEGPPAAPPPRQSDGGFV